MTADLEVRDQNDDLGVQIARIYAGPLDAFVSQRNALAKELRDGGRRDDAKTVKALRKPKRVAWALNVVASEEPDRVESVAAAVATALDAQTGHGDVRASLSDLRNAAQGLAVAAARIARAREHSFDEVELANAVMAIVGSQDAFASLKSGRLVEVPEGGGLDLLTLAAAVDEPGPEDAELAAQPESREDHGDAAIRRAERALEDARDHLADAEQALTDAEANAHQADRKLRQAQEDAYARRAAVERARAGVRAAADHVGNAEEAVAKLRPAGSAD